MPAKLSVNLNNFIDNINEIKKHIGKKELLVMVKADAYGAGIKKISKCLENNNVRFLGVAFLTEAKEVLKNNINSEVIMFSNILLNEIKEAVKLGITLTVSDIETVKNIDKEAKKQNKKIKIHINIDTGMARLGILKENIDPFITEIKQLKNIVIEGLFTHFSSADTDEKYTKMQIEMFKEALIKFKKQGINPRYIHVANSIGTILNIGDFCNMVRVGIAAYGYYPTTNFNTNNIYNNDFRKKVKTNLNKENLKQIITLKGVLKMEAPICSIKEIDKDKGISYSKTYITDKQTKVGVVEIGYADGLNRLLSNKYNMLINGKEAKIIGNICMDMCMIDITNIDNIKCSDMAVIFDYTDFKIDEIAKICNTINYEIITTIGKRLKRAYVFNNKV